MPDDVPLLRRLEADSLLVLTPPQDYDDSVQGYPYPYPYP